jgi:hypothetical protein
MRSKWLIDDYIIQTSYHEDFRDVLKRNNFEFEVKKYIPFSEKVETVANPDDCVVIYGSIGFVKQYLNQGFIPGAYLEEKSMNCIGYMPFIEDFNILANSNNVFTTYEDLKNRKEFFYDIFRTNKIFVRPNCGLKTFTGLPIHYDEFNHETNSLEKLTSVEKNTLILVSNCKTITNEYRFFIVNREVITGSQYKLNDELNVQKGYSQEAFAIAEKMAKNKWQPDLAYVCDVGIVNGEPKIIELNSFSCSGFYACDMNKIVEAVDLIAVKEYNGEISIGEI